MHQHPQTSTLGEMTPELIDLILENLEPPEIVPLMKTCRALRELGRLAIHRNYFESYVVPRLLQRLVDSSGPGENETADPESQQTVVVAALDARTRYLAGSTSTLIDDDDGDDDDDGGRTDSTGHVYYYCYHNAPTTPARFNIQRNQKAMTHVNRAFWHSKMTLLHAAAMSGADNVVQKLLESGAAEAEVNVETRAGDCESDYESFHRLTPLEVAVAYNRTTTAAILLHAGAAVGRSWVLALDAGNVASVRLILAQDPDIARRSMPSHVGPPTMGTFLYHRHGWALAGRVYRPLPASVVSELIRAGADMYFRWKWDDENDGTDQSLIRAVHLRWEDVALVLASEWAGREHLDQLLAYEWDVGGEDLVRRCIDRMKQRGITPSSEKGENSNGEGKTFGLEKRD